MCARLVFVKVPTDKLDENGFNIKIERKELILECQRAGRPETITITKSGAVLDGGNKKLTEEFIDCNKKIRIRRIEGEVKLVGKSNKDLTLVEETNDPVTEKVTDHPNW